MKTTRPRTRIGLLALTLSVLVPSAALALPSEGDAAPNAQLEDVEGRGTELRAFKGKPILIVYEDKDSATQNQSLKNALSKLAKGGRYKSAIVLAAVADVSAYDYWPVRGFVKDAIREESRKQGTTIYCDWNGAFRGRYSFRRGVSSIVLVGRNGHVLFAAEGAVDPEQQKRLVSLLRAEVE